MKESDFIGLPEQTIRFVERLLNLGFDRERVFGLFTLVGLYAGSPNTQDKIEELYSALQSVLPREIPKISKNHLNSFKKSSIS